MIQEISRLTKTTKMATTFNHTVFSHMVRDGKWNDIIDHIQSLETPISSEDTKSILKSLLRFQDSNEKILPILSALLSKYDNSDKLFLKVFKNALLEHAIECTF